jgi:hypothetical protein
MARGVEELEKLAVQDRREAAEMKAAAKEKYAEAEELLSAAKKQFKEAEVVKAEASRKRKAAKAALEDSKFGADWAIDFLSKKRVRNGVTEYRVVWAPTWESESVVLASAEKCIEEFEAASSLNDTE